MPVLLCRSEGWQLWLEEDPASALPQHGAYVALRLQVAEADALRIAFPGPLQIPIALIDAAQDPPRLRFEGTSDGADPGKAALLSRLVHLQGSLAAGATFFGADRFDGQAFVAAAAGGVAVAARLDARCLYSGTVAADAVLSFHVTAALTASITVMQGDASAQRAWNAACELAVELRGDGQWARVGIDGLALRLPSWRLPAWHLSGSVDWIPPRLNLPDADLLTAFGLQARTRIDGTPLHAAMTLADGDLQLTLASATPGQQVRITTTVAHNEAVVLMASLRFQTLRFDRGQVAGATLQVMAEAADIPDGAWSRAGIALQWTAARLQLHWTDGEGMQLHLAFDRLAVASVDDPATQVALAGALYLRPSGLQIERLELLPPYPVALAARVLQVAGQTALTVLEFTTDAAAELLCALAAVLRMVLRALGAVARGLAGLARLAAELIGRLIAQLPSLEAGAPNMTLQCHFTRGDVMRLRRVLLLHDALQPAAVLGLQLGFGQTRLGWLLDLPAPDMASLHVLALLQDTQSRATLSTDLWLGDSALREVDGTSGQRAATPVLQLDIQPAATSALPLAVALAGIDAAGQASFLQQVPMPPNGGPLQWVSDLPLQPVQQERFHATLQVDQNRLLPFLNGPDPGVAAGGFFDRIGQTVRIVRTDSPVLTNGSLSLPVLIEIKLLGLQVQAQLALALDLATLKASLSGADATFPVHAAVDLQGDALGLHWHFRRGPADAHGTGALFLLSLGDGNTTLRLAPGARLELGYVAASPSGRGIFFEVRESGFQLSRTGLDLDAALAGDKPPPLLNGLDLPLQPTAGRLVLRNSQLVEASLTAIGRLPPALVGEVQAEVSLRWQQNGSQGLVLAAAQARLSRPGAPVLCHGTRFRLTLRELAMGFVRDQGEHFYFLISGALEFRPNAGEFGDGLLKHLKDLRLELDQVPLAADAAVLARHINFQVELTPPARATLFNVFRFTLRGIGYHPWRDWAQGPALRLSGQLAFLDIGDVMQPGIDFHGLEIAPPAGGSPLPRVRCEGLGVDLRFGGSTRISGSVMAVDEQNTHTVFDPKLLPQGYNTYGFLGAGRVSIEGFTSLAINLGFLEIEPERGAPRQRAFFLYLERHKLSYRIPTPIVPIYLREVGLGFGHRFTLVGIKAAEIARSLAEMVQRLDELSRRQGELARFEAWMPDPEPAGEAPRSSLALRGAFSINSASEGEVYNADAERELDNPFLFDVVAVLRSDFTFLMTARGWLSMNYADFLAAPLEQRTRPGFSGYLYLSAPRSELLARVVGWPDGHIGSHPPLHPELVKGLRSVQYAATLYIRPGLFHFELGWPDQLRWQWNEGPLALQCAGGVLISAHEDALVYALNFRAQATLRFGGELSAGSLGVSAQGELNVALQSRLFAALSLRQAGDTLLYGLLAVEAALRLSVSAWLRINLLFRKITLSVSFSFEVQIAAVAEVVVGPTQIGARASVRVGLRAFGHTLSVAVGLAFNTDQLDQVRARVQRYMALGVASAGGAAPDAQTLLQRRDKADLQAQREGQRPQPLPAISEAPAGAPMVVQPTLPIDGFTAEVATVFSLVLRRAEGGAWIAALVPRADEAGFFAAPPLSGTQALGGALQAPDDDYRLSGALPAGLQCWVPREGWRTPAQEAGPPVLSTDWNADLDGTLCWELLYGAYGWTAAGNRLQPRDPPQRTIDDRSAGTPDPQDAALRGQLELAARRRDPNTDTAAAVHDWRDFVLTTLLADLAAVARAPGDASQGRLLRASGLLLRLPQDGLQALAQWIDHARTRLARRCVDGQGASQYLAAAITLFNPPATFFETARPLLDMLRSGPADGAGGASGAIGLDWRLRWRDTPPPTQTAPEHYLSHYRITRAVEGMPGLTPAELRIKPCPPLHASAAPGTPAYLAPTHWQATDRFDDAPALLRQALVPADGDDALAGAMAWAALFGEKAQVAVVYTVQPVDLAGTEGPGQQLVAWVARPAAPLRPARAELLFDFGPLAATPGGPRSSLDIFLHLDDPYWAQSPQRQQPQNGGWTVTRRYLLQIDLEDTLPLGSYGSDGATDAPLDGAGLPRGAAVDERFAFDHARWAALKKMPRAADWDHLRRLGEVSGAADDTRDFVPLALSRLGPLGSPRQLLAPAEQARLLDRLWTACRGLESDGRASAWPPIRRAARFHLLTRVELQQGDRKPIVHDATPVPIDFEMRLAPPPSPPGSAPMASPPYVLRPAWFEWPLAAELPALVLGDLHCRSGFLARLQPVVSGTYNPTLADLLAGQGLGSVRDPARRVVTELRWNAFPSALWPRSDGAAAEAQRAALVAGYQLHELDLDQLPVEDIDDGRIQPRAWTRALPRARVQLQDPQGQWNQPPDTNDGSAWQAVYPSEAWRTQRTGDAKTPLPQRRPWLSTREALPVWPRLVPRRRLLPVVEDRWVDAVLAAGLAFPLTLRLTTDAAPPCRLVFDRDGLALPAGWDLVFTRFTAIDDTRAAGADRLDLIITAGPSLLTTAAATTLRQLLGRLALVPDLEQAGGDPQALEASWHRALYGDTPVAFALQVLGTQRSVASTIPVDLRGPLHPILADTLSLLRDQLARRPHDAHRVAVQILPLPGRGEATRAGFMNATASADDPFGWAALRRLGLAACVRVHDLDTAEPLRLDTLLADVGLQACLATVQSWYRRDWAPLYGTDRPPPFGHAMVDVLCRPFALDRLDDFDQPAGQADGRTLALKDEALASWQVSLRPVPWPVWRPAKCRITWPAAALPATQTVSVRLQLADATVACQILDAQAGPNAAPCWLAAGAATMVLTLRREGGDCVATLHLAVWAPPGAALPGLQVQLADAAALQVALTPIDWLTDAAAPLGRFALPDATAFTQAAAWKNQALASFVAPLDAVLQAHRPADAPAPTPEDNGDASVAQALDWAARFLEHAALPTAEPVASYALCSPKRLNPWRLAPDAAGCLRLLLPHEDRWARVRAYAVKPFSRYEDLARAAGYGGYFMTTLADTTLPSLQIQAVDHTDAVTPRTERLLPPAFLGSRARADAAGPVWELVLATHPEQPLAESNRMLAARLDFRGVGLSFFRRYHYHGWLQRLGLEPDLPYRAVGALPDGELPLQDSDHEGPQVDDSMQWLPALQHGGQVFELQDLPYCYRSNALAVAQAGVVVSPIARTEQRDFGHAFRLAALPAPQLDVIVEDGVAALHLRLPLVRHRDLVSEATLRQWFDNPADGIANVPDPEVVYGLVLARRGGQPATWSVQELEVEVNAVWHGRQDAAPAPYVARALGTVLGLREGAPPTPADVAQLPVTQQDGLYGVTVRLQPRAAQARWVGLNDARKAALQAASMDWPQVLRFVRVSATWNAAPTAEAWNTLRQWVAQAVVAADDPLPQLPEQPPAAPYSLRFDALRLEPDDAPAPMTMDAQGWALRIAQAPSSTQWTEFVQALGADPSDLLPLVQRLARNALNGGAYDCLRVRPTRGAIAPPAEGQLPGWDLALYPLPGEAQA